MFIMSLIILSLKVAFKSVLKRPPVPVGHWFTYFVKKIRYIILIINIFFPDNTRRVHELL